jgi:hypothetical protein
MTIYTVTGTDANGCTGTDFITIGVDPLPVITVTPASATVCSGSSGTLTAGGAINYTWLPGPVSGASVVITPGASGVYTVTGNNGNCSNTATVSVSLIPSPTVTINASKSSVCPGQNVVLTAGGAVGYILVNTSAALPGSSVVVSPTITTTYSISGTAANNCSNVGVKTVTVDACVGLETISKTISNELRLFPNPSKGEFTMATETDARFEIINSIGQVVRTVILDEKNDHKTQITNLPGGIYFVSSLNDKNAPKRKVIVTR